MEGVSLAMISGGFRHIFQDEEGSQPLRVTFLLEASSPMVSPVPTPGLLWRKRSLTHRLEAEAQTKRPGTSRCPAASPFEGLGLCEARRLHLTLSGALASSLGPVQLASVTLSSGRWRLAQEVVWSVCTFQLGFPYVTLTLGCLTTCLKPSAGVHEHT